MRIISLECWLVNLFLLVDPLPALHMCLPLEHLYTHTNNLTISDNLVYILTLCVCAVLLWHDVGLSSSHSRSTCTLSSSLPSLQL